MDPDANLIEQRVLAARIQVRYDSTGEVDPADAATLVELVLALDKWITEGGFLPAPWQKAQQP